MSARNVAERVPDESGELDDDKDDDKDGALQSQCSPQGESYGSKEDDGGNKPRRMAHLLHLLQWTHEEECRSNSKDVAKSVHDGEWSRIDDNYAHEYRALFSLFVQMCKQRS